jgi:hypothetical protein
MSAVKRRGWFRLKIFLFLNYFHPAVRALALFMLQQPLFTPDTAAETDQFAITSDNAMAGNNQGNRVFVVGVAHSPEGSGAADGPGNVSVGGSLAKGNFLQLPPDGFLKIGSFKNQGDAEFLAPAFEIFSQLPQALRHAGRQVAVGLKFVRTKYNG